MDTKSVLETSVDGSLGLGASIVLRSNPQTLESSMKSSSGRLARDDNRMSDR